MKSYIKHITSTFSVLAILLGLMTLSLDSRGGGTTSYNAGTSSVTHPVTLGVAASEANRQILLMSIGGTNSGGGGDWSICQMQFTMQNTADADVANAKLYHNTTNTLTDGTAGSTLLGTVVSPAGTITFNFSHPINKAGPHYFYLTFDIVGSPTTCTNSVDAFMEANGMTWNDDATCTGSSTSVTMPTPDPSGNRTVEPSSGTPSTLSAGDIAIIGFNMDNPDMFTFVALTDLAYKTEIKFTDNGWLSSGSFRAGEGTLIWTGPGCGVTCGTEITVTDLENPFSVSSGSITDAGTFLMALAGDQILAYQGADGSPTHIFAVNNSGAGVWQADAIDANTSALPTGLTNTINAVALNRADNAKYDCSETSGTAPALAAICDETNWTTSGTPLGLPPACAIACNIVADRLTFTNIPGSCREEGQTFSILVCATDAGLNVDNTFTGTITISKASGSGTLSGTLFKDAVAGCATFADLAFDAADSYTLTASESGSLTDGTSGSFTISASGACSSNGIIVNEFSNGPSGSKEYVELLVVGTACGTVDLRGYILDDNNGASNDGFSDRQKDAGVADGYIVFKTIPAWQFVPVGALIVIYNESDANGLLPADDPDDTGTPDSVYILPGNHANLRKCTSTPFSSGSGSALYSPCALSDPGSWSTISMRNAGDAMQVRNLDETYWHGISYGNNVTYNMTGGPDDLNVLPSDGTAKVLYFSDADYRDVANFTSAAAPGAETPGVGNDAANIAYITALRCAPCASPATADAGLDATICENSTYTLAGAVIGGSATTQTWANGGGDGTFDDNTLLNPTYTPGATDISGGTVTLTITTDDPDGAGPCPAASNSMTLTISTCNGTWSIGGSGTLVRTRSTSSDNWQVRYDGGISNIPTTAFWIVRKNTADDPSLSSVGAYYPNLTIENDNGSAWTTGAGSKFTGSSGYPTVLGDLDIGGGGADAVIFVNDNTHADEIMVHGDIIVQTASTLQNYGTGFETRGDLNIDGTFSYDADDARNLVFSGGNAQLVVGAGTIGIYDMEVNKFTDAVTLNRAVTVDNILTLTIGELKLNSQTLSITNDATTAIVQTNGYIVSESEASILKWTIQAADVTYVFPFGYVSDLIPFTFDKTNTDGTVLEISTWHTDTTNQVGMPTGATLLAAKGTNQFIDRWYDITPTPNVDANLTFKWTPSETSGLDYTTTPYCWHWNDGTTSWDSIPAAAGLESVTALWTTYSHGGGGGGGGDPLPIELLHFDAKYNKITKDVDLTWATASEINNDYFTVERSRDASDFDIVVSVPGAGNSNQTLYYEAVDENPTDGLMYYRLKQTDFDFNFEYSELVTVNILKDLSFSVRPNPAHDFLEIKFGEITNNTVFVMTPEYNAEMRIYDARGSMVYEKKFDGTFYKFNINISDFENGMYIVKLIANEENYTAKFIKE